MAVLKTQPTNTDVLEYISRLDDSQRRDSETLIEMMQRLTGDQPVMWGPSIIGFGNRHLTYASGRELDWMKLGFAARKGTMVVYSLNDLSDHKDELDKMGKYKSGKSCLYIKQLADIDLKKLEVFLKKGL